MSTLMVEGPCGWDVEPCPNGCLPEPPASPGESPGEIVGSAFEVMAVGMLWRWTGQIWGQCPVTVRPCRDEVPCGRCGQWLYGRPKCGCRSLNEIVLPGPVTDVLEVVVDGAPLDESAYRVDDYAWLVRLDGEQWPRCSDLTANEDEPGSFIVTYLYGFPPPAGAAVVAGELACELSKAFCNDDGCRLPSNLVRNTRQGVVQEFGDGIGITTIDQWVKAANAPPRRSSVYSPDLPPPPRRTTWP